MFNTIDEAEKVVFGTYKKVKSYFYYDKTLLLLKKSIIEFEASDDFENKLKDIAYRIYNEDMDYFEKLIEKISFDVVPKKFESRKSKVIQTGIDKDKIIKKINFSIILPVELIIVDFLWMLIVKKIYTLKYGPFLYSYAGIFKKGLFNNNSDNIVNGIDFDSNRCFEPYFSCYKSWRDNAIKKVDELVTEHNAIMITLDLKSFYYNVNFDFNYLKELLGDLYETYNLSFMTQIIKGIYEKYTKSIRKYRIGIEREKGKVVFPIGLTSPIVLRDIVMNDIDKELYEKIDPAYYGRYVDDMLLVIPYDKDNINISKDEILKTFFIEKSIITEKKSDIYSFNCNNHICLQNEKINVFYFSKGNENILVEHLLDEIKKNSSEYNLLPDIDLLNESFNNTAYNFQFSDSTNKLREFKVIESDNYRATLFINGLKRTLKNTEYNLDEIKKYINDIMRFYSGSQSIEFYTSWRNIFELMVQARCKDEANSFYKKTKETIKNLSLEDLENDETTNDKKLREKLEKNLKDGLNQKLELAISLALSLDLRRVKDSQKQISMAKKIRKANMLNHQMIALPLLNYIEDDNYQIESYINIEVNDVINIINNNRDHFDKNKSRFKWSPRFIHLNEFCFYNFYYNIGKVTKVNDKFDTNFFNKYVEYNNLSVSIECPFEETKSYNLENVNYKYITVNNYSKDKNKKGDIEIRIGVVSANVDEKKVLDILQNPLQGITVSNKRILYKILNDAKENGVKYLVFPEFYMPALWLNDVGQFAKDNGITIITGLQYVTVNKQYAYNFVCVLQALCSKRYYKNIVPFIRQKNYYAPSEKMELAAFNYISNDSEKPLYYIFDCNGERYSTILCYEFTDIISRAGLKGKIDFLCVPQLNRDTNYFSSIVESASRDLFAFVIQANTSKYGDSRVTGPYSSNVKDILKIKGGENQLLIIGDIRKKELNDVKNNYYFRQKVNIELCLKCKKIKKTTDIEKCENCSKKIVGLSKEIKGLPPNWHNGSNN